MIVLQRLLGLATLFAAAYAGIVGMGTLVLIHTLLKPRRRTFASALARG